MADVQRSKSATGSSQQQPSRLQRRAPSSLQINRSYDWNVAIPLLSPLVSSPTAVELKATAAMEELARQPEQSSEPENLVFKKWQHPAAPFCYEPASLVPRPFVSA